MSHKRSYLIKREEESLPKKVRYTSFQLPTSNGAASDSEMIQCRYQDDLPMITIDLLYSSLLQAQDTNQLPTVIVQMISDYAICTSALFYCPLSPKISTYHGIRERPEYREAMQWLNPDVVGSCYSLPSSTTPGARLARFHGAVSHFFLHLTWPVKGAWTEGLSVLNTLIDLVEWDKDSSNPPSFDGPRLTPPTDINTWGIVVALAFSDTIDQHFNKEEKMLIDRAYYEKVDAQWYQYYKDIPESKGLVTKTTDKGVIFGNEDSWRFLNPIHCVIRLAYQTGVGGPTYKGTTNIGQLVLVDWTTFCAHLCLSLPNQQLKERSWRLWFKTILYTLGNINKYNKEYEGVGCKKLGTIFDLLSNSVRI